MPLNPPPAPLPWIIAGLVPLLGGCELLSRGGQAERPEARVAATYTLDAVQIGEVDGVPIYDGGYSSLTLAPDGAMWIVTDRGPNLEALAHAGLPAKRFPLPAYVPTAERVEVDGERLRVREQRPFLTANGRPATGLPPPRLDDDIEVEVGYGPDFGQLGLDAEGIDSEGIAFGGGGLWVAEEYRPSLWRLDPSSGRVLERFTPTPTETYDRPLPAWLLQREPNLGFEGVAFAGGYVYASLQGPIQPPGGDLTTRITRILRLDPGTGDVLAYAYALEGSTRKIGDLSVLPDGRLLVLEHGLIPGRGWSAEVYVVPLGQSAPINVGGSLPPERFRDPESAIIGGVSLLPKTLYVDLIAAGWELAWDKPEGLAAAPDGRLLLVNDNDFGLISPSADGRAVASDAATVLVVVE